LASDEFVSLTAWNSPQVNVPHFYWAAAVEDESLSLTVDFRPRAAAGYDTILPDGSYPQPTSREMFMMGSIRKELAEAYFTENVVDWFMSVKAVDGAVTAVPPTVPVPCAGPLLLDLVMPLSEAAVDVACAACEAATAHWISWMESAEKLDQRRIMTVFAHDSKVRASCLGMTTHRLERRFGAEAGSTLAAADAGPMDIANRGAAQNAAAADNFDASEKDASAMDMQRLLDEQTRDS